MLNSKKSGGSRDRADIAEFNQFIYTTLHEYTGRFNAS